MRWNIIGNFNRWEPNFIDRLKQSHKAINDNRKIIKPKDTQPLRRWDFNECGWTELSKNPFDNGQAFIRKLQKKGFKALGHGHYSTVLAKGDSNRVIKVCHHEDGDSWIDYCLWAAQKGYAGTLAPRVYSYKKIGKFYVAIVERMQYTASSKSFKDKGYIYPYLFRVASEFKNDEASDILDILIPGAKKFGQDFIDQFKDGRFDLHDGNIMFRADGSMCVTDPVCHRSSLTVTRLRAKDFGFAAH